MDRKTASARAGFVSITAFASLTCAAQADLSISSKPTQNVDCSGGVCTPTAKNAVLNVGDLTGMLASGDVTVQTGDGNQTAAGIDIVTGFSWTSTNRLTLTAKHDIV